MSSVKATKKRKKRDKQNNNKRVAPLAKRKRQKLKTNHNVDDAEDKSKDVPQRIQMIFDDTRCVCCVHMRTLPDTKVIVLGTGSLDKTVRLYSSSINQNSPHFTLQADILHSSVIISAVEFNKLGTSILYARDDGQCVVCDVRTISAPTQIKVLDHPNEVVSAHWCGKNGDTIITACRDNYIRN